MLVQAPCRVHARRNFCEAHQLRPQAHIARGVVERMDQPFALHARVRAEGCDPPARDAPWQQSARPLLEAFKPLIEAVEGLAATSDRSARHYHALTEQTPGKVFVLTTTEASVCRLSRSFSGICWPQRLRLYSRFF